MGRSFHTAPRHRRLRVALWLLIATWCVVPRVSAQAAAPGNADAPRQPKEEFALGVRFLQEKNDPKTAARHLARIAPPTAVAVVARERYDPREKLYLAAQQLLVRCELELDDEAAAEKRHQALVKRYPYYREYLESEYAFAKKGLASKREYLRRKRASEARRKASKGDK